MLSVLGQKDQKMKSRALINVNKINESQQSEPQEEVELGQQQQIELESAPTSRKLIGDS